MRMTTNRKYGKHALRGQWKRDLDYLSPWLFGVVVIVVSAAFISSLGLFGSLNLGWGFYGLAVAFVGLFSVALAGAFWASNKNVQSQGDA